MARRGFGGMTALQAALGAATGIGEALQKRDLLAEEKRQRMLLEARQKAQDEAALRAEERQAVEAGMISADRLPTLTMPGATPLPDMQPTLRQTIGGKEYAYIPRMAQAEKHRGDVMKIALENASKTPTRRLQFSDGQIIDLEAGTATPVKGYVAPKKGGGGGGGGGSTGTKGGPNAEELARAVGVWNSLTNVPDAQLSPEEVQFRNTMVRTFDKLRGRGTARESTAPAEQLIFQAVSAADAQNKRIAAPPKGEETDPLAQAREEARRRDAAKKGGTAASPAPAPAAPSRRPSIEDAAAKQARRAQRWDQIKAQNPSMSDDAITAQVMREIP